jgi:rubrerythrin
MADSSFDSIIDFAIQREKEAVQFYIDLQSVDQLEEKRTFMKSLENMERGHITALENIRAQDIDEMEVPEITNLEISDYLVEVDPGKKMSYQDILILGMKREERANKLYLRLAESFSKGGMNKIFRRLASEEAKHKLFFESLYDEEILREN